jgi:hypothetical protein
MPVEATVQSTPTSIPSKATHTTSKLTRHKANDPQSPVTLVQPASAAVALQTSPTTPDRSCIATEELVDGLEVAAEQVQKEAALAKEISRLWSSHVLRTHMIRKTRKELTDYRNKLAERLSQYKDLLARTGRDGKWMEFLRDVDIPRTTADRCIAKWKLSQAPKSLNRTTGAICEPSKQTIAEMVKKVKVKVEPVLTSPESIAAFITELAAALQPPTTIS